MMIVAAMTFLSGMAIAQDSNTLAEKLMALNRLEQSMRENANAFAEGFKESIGQTLRREKPELSDEALGELFQIMDDEIASTIDRMSEPLKAMFIAFYVDNFSEDELSVLVEMHSSEVYQKQLSLMPGFMREGAKLQAELQLEAQGRMSERVKEWLQKYE